MDQTDAPPIPGAHVRRATAADAAELLVLQRCCWVEEALANQTLDIPALHESLDDVRSWIETWSTWCVRLDGRLIGAARAHQDGAAWEIGRLMVAPDLAGHGLGRWLLAHAEDQAPEDVEQLALFTGAASVRNLAMYERAGYRRGETPAPPGVVGLVKPLRAGPGPPTGPGTTA
jgi:GNAT superfamily N-acetyltransferase